MVDPRMFTEAIQLFEEGSALVDEKRYDEAISVLDRALKINPNLSEAHFKTGGGCLVRLAMCILIPAAATYILSRLV